MRNQFTPDFDSLPAQLPLFPLTGAVIFPNGQLPLNIFEPRYVSMVMDSLSSHRLIGMVQPKEITESDDDSAEDSEHNPQLYSTGCAGRIVSFSETRDDRLLVVLSGVCRFDIVSEFSSEKEYRLAEVEWKRFSSDLIHEEIQIDQGRLLASARRFIESKNLSVDWNALDQLAMPELVDTLASSLPFSPEEKQGLVEAVVIHDRLELLTALCDFGSVDADYEKTVSH